MTASADALARAKAAMRLELSKPRVTWRRTVAAAVGALVGLCATVALVLFAVGAATPELAGSHGVAMALLVTLAALASVSALAPGPRSRRLAGAGALALGAVLLVAVRGAGAVSPSPQWVCTVSHLGVDLLPAVVMVLALRRAAPNRLRALLGGLAAGTVGAFAGELACGQSSLHVALFHLPAWAAVAVAVAVISSKVQPRSFAP